VNPAYHFLRYCLLALSWPPLSWSRAAGRGLGWLGYKLDVRHRRIVAENLRASFPDKDEEWVRATARACYEHLGQVLAEIPHLFRLSPDKIAARVRVHGAGLLQEVLARQKGLIFLTGHLGNWEWGSVALGHNHVKGQVVVRPLDWAPADRLVNQWRTKSGHVMADKAGSARRLLSHIRKQGVVGILLDQNVDWYDGVWVDFFGRPACTNKGLALLALATEAPVVLFYSRRSPDGYFDLYLGPEVPLVRMGDKTKDVWQNTQNYTKALENVIRQCPEQWFWLHQRWKTKPYHPWPRGKA